MLDIDKFKRINDSLGHSCGDQVIQHTVNTLKRGLRKSDCFGRIGGEEFAIILYDTDLNKAADVAEKLRASLLEEKGFFINNDEVQVTVSIGVSHVCESDNDIKSILARADKAMYDSKHNGRNRVSCYSVDYE